MGHPTQIIFDLETLGVRPDSIIVSIGALKFSLSQGIMDAFYMNIDPVDSKKYGLTTDKETINWWANQPKEVSDVWRKNPKPLKYVMQEFSDWYGGKGKPIWAKGGVSFDFPIMESSFIAVGMKPPYHFRDCLDCRTIFNVLGVKDYANKPEGLQAHNALDDCKIQLNSLLPLLVALDE